jgi:hypothetical protein
MSSLLLTGGNGSRTQVEFKQGIYTVGGCSIHRYCYLNKADGELIDVLYCQTLWCSIYPLS